MMVNIVTSYMVRFDVFKEIEEVGAVKIVNIFAMRVRGMNI